MIDLDELERLAQEAAPGPWRATHTSRHWVHAPTSGYMAEVEAWADADYIAAASPDVILDLIARVRAAEERERQTRDAVRMIYGVEIQTQKSPHQPEG